MKIKTVLKSFILFSLLLIPSAIFAQQDDIDPSNSPACAIISNNLKYGNRDTGSGSEVSILQDFLNTKNYLITQPTGFFGKATLIAVKAFQKDNNISPTGYVGTVTRSKIKQIDCDMTPPSNSSSSPSVNPVNLVNAGIPTPPPTPQYYGNVQAPTSVQSGVQTISFSNIPSVLYAGQTYKVTWNNDDPSTVVYGVYLYSDLNDTSTTSLKYNVWSVSLGSVNAQVKSYTFTIPANINPNGGYSLYLKKGTSNSSQMLVSNKFTISSSGQITPAVLVPPTSPVALSTSTTVQNITYSKIPRILYAGQTYNITWTNYDAVAAKYNIFLYNPSNDITSSAKEITASTLMGSVDAQTKNLTFKIPANMRPAYGYGLYFKNKSDNSAPVSSSREFEIKSI